MSSLLHVRAEPLFLGINTVFTNEAVPWQHALEVVMELFQIFQGKK